MRRNLFIKASSMMMQGNGSGNIDGNTVVLIIWGQSNAVGWTTGAPSNPSLTAPISGTLIYNGTTFATIDYPTNNEGVAGHGVELNFAYLYTQAHPGKNLLINKVSSGSTSLAIEWATSGTLFSNLVNEINFTKSYCQASGLTPTFYLYGNQGERDSNNGTWANSWSGNYLTWINTLEASTGVHFEKIVHTRITSALTTTYENVMRDQVMSLTGSSISDRYTWINQDDLILQGDGVHFTSDSQNILASRLYSILNLP